MKKLETTPMSEVTYGENFYIKALLVGPSGSGKTVSFSTFPSKTRLLIDTDNGAEVLIGEKDIDLIRINQTSGNQSPYLQLHQAFLQIKALIGKDEFPYSVIQLDSVTRLYDYALDHAMSMDSSRNPGGTPTSNHWAVQKRLCQEIIEFFLDAPIHFIAAVHEEAQKDELLGSVTIIPRITGKHARWITERFREVYGCFGKPRKSSNFDGTEFLWRTQPTNQRPWIESSLNTRLKYWGPEVDQNWEELFKKRGIEVK